MRSYTLQTSNPCATTRKHCNRPNFVAKGSSYHEIAFGGNGCKKSQTNVSCIKLDSFYVLTKGANGVKAPWMGSKKKAIWVPKSLVTNLQGSKQVWIPKKNWSFFVGQLQSQRKALGS